MTTELFQSTETEPVKILIRVCQPIGKMKQWPTDWRHSIDIQFPGKEMTRGTVL